jgi:bla regulator protein blaR1
VTLGYLTIGDVSLPAIADHLWQSTLFAVAAALLTVVLRHNRARDRYGLWLAASVKFLIPFSLFAALGSALGAGPELRAPPAALLLLSAVSHPFAGPGALGGAAGLVGLVPGNLTRALPWLAGVWALGFIAVVSAWCARWRRLSMAIRGATPLEAGREVEVLRRMERIGGIRRPIAVLLSGASLEPGVFGILSPVLLWPRGMSAHLDDAHLEAVVAHEVWHVRRRDNLAAALHVLVEATFWFHPLVWWLGARLVAERERACDEQVLEFGSARTVYAEGILKTCEFCVRYSLPFLSSVTGADLKRRIAEIMTRRTAHKLDLGKKLLLGSAASLTFVLPVLCGLIDTAAQERAVRDVFTHAATPELCPVAAAAARKIASAGQQS